VLQGSAIRRAEPLFPALAKAAQISGSVVIEVTIDQAGYVTSARPVSGHPLLKNAAENAARGWKFTPTLLAGQPVKVIGTVTFNFDSSASGTSVSTGDGSGGGMGTGSRSGVGPGRTYNLGGGAATSAVDSKPVPLNNPRPRYTSEARANKTQGEVTVRVLVGVDGLVKDVRVIRGLPDGLTEEAVKVAREVKFKPAMKDGQPVEHWVPLIMTFSLR
jgi:TonB family protein